MLLLRWDPIYSVGIKEIDNQHMKLIDYINELNTAMGQGKGRDQIGKTIEKLLNYTVTHFQVEEKYFKQYGYPETAQHKTAHDLFVDKIKEFKDQFENGRITLTIQVMNFLKEWLKNHILVEDKKYSPFLVSKGLK